MRGLYILCRSSLLSSLLFSLQSLRFRIVAMPLSEYLWPSGSIFATLLSPFGPAMGARLVGWVRDRRLLGLAVRWMFPADPPVSISPPRLAVRDDALLAAVQEGLEAASMSAELKAAIEDQNEKLQQLIDGNRELLEVMTQLQRNTYTVTSIITPRAT